ncbi:hypothetical protein E2C01_034221 [Portunus trituberculatus]|uniref:Uncharacterized protein n=1 Tax=Portunus trituberculatus TaxID=210409 RepID=A0A5B7F5K6_PORTR|nr:hypothetical protein [Portunus trituberculatus]
MGRGSGGRGSAGLHLGEGVSMLSPPPPDSPAQSPPRPGPTRPYATWHSFTRPSTPTQACPVAHWRSG